MLASDLKEFYQERRLKELNLCGPLRQDELTGESSSRSARDLDW